MLQNLNNEYRHASFNLLWRCYGAFNNLICNLKTEVSILRSLFLSLCDMDQSVTKQLLPLECDYLKLKMTKAESCNHKSQHQNGLDSQSLAG